MRLFLTNLMSHLLRRPSSPILLLAVLLIAVPLTTANAQTKYTADFSTSPIFDYEGGQTYYKTRATVSIGGVNYLIHNAINADFTWNGSAVSYNPYSGVGLIIEREDNQAFNFYGIDLNYTSVNTDLAHAPWLTVSYQGANGPAAPADAYNETSKNFSVSKPAGLAVKYVQLYFADLATLVLDNLIVGPADTTPTCFNPSVPTIAATRTAICAGSNTTLSIQSGSLNDATNWKWYSGSCGGTLVGTGPAIQVSPSSTTTYYVRGEGGCVTPGSCASQEITVTSAFFANLTNNGPLTCAKPSVTLSASGATGATYAFRDANGPIASSGNMASVSSPGTYTVTASLNACSSTVTTTVGINTTPPSVSISPSATAICAGQSVTLNANASTSGGTLSYRWITNATSPSISVSATGPYSVTVTRSDNGCVATATASVSVNPLPTPSILGLASAYCQDAGSQALSGSPSGGVFTVDGSPATSFNPTSLTVGQHTVVYSYTNTNGCANTTSQTVMVKEVPPSPTLLTAPGQSYPTGVSSLTVVQYDPPVQLVASGCNGSVNLNGSNTGQLSISATMTGTQTYTATCTQNGCTSPTASFALTVLPVTLEIYSATKDSPLASQVQTRLELRNTGSTPVAVSSLSLRYYFTSDNNQLANVYVDYAAIGALTIAAKVVKLTTPVGGADSYVELSFPGSPLTLNPMSSLGYIDFRIVRSDYGLLDQTNDYSYIANYGNVGYNNRITAYVNNNLAFGIPPSGASARMVAVEPVAPLQVKVLGNPVVGSTAQVEIRGAEGQPVNLRLIDLQGRSIHEQRIEQAAETESVSVPLGQSRGLLLLKVSTDSQQQSLKLLRP